MMKDQSPLPHLSLASPQRDTDTCATPRNMMIWLKPLRQGALSLGLLVMPLSGTAQDPPPQNVVTSPTRALQGDEAVAHNPLVPTVGLLGQSLASHPTSDAASGIARTMATRAANDEIQTWLSRYGNARVQLNVDKNFTLQDSAFDWLLPLYNDESWTVFSQLGARNKDRRNTLNAGLGVRTLQGGWLLGVNSFYDYDLSGHNRRLGLGLEAWTDYWRLSGNQYLRLSDWRASRDITDYDERPANGFDIRINGWLPTLPQLGGSFIYEQYRGDHVALFGRNTLQANPYAFTAGINYTPFPLLTLGLDERRGKGGQHDTQISATLTYRLADDGSTQLDSSRVAAMRTLANSRHDFVERNNDIVLAYRQPNLLNISSTEYLEGYAGESAAIQVSINSKHAIDYLDWQNTASFLLAGGSINVLPNNSLALIYPPYNQQGENRYNIDVIAYDIKGHRSNLSTTRIQVLQSQREIVPTILAGNLIVTQDNAKADGSAQNAVRARVTDANGNPLANQTVQFSADNGATLSAQQAASDADGYVTVTLTSLTAGPSHVSATLSNHSQASVTTTFVADDSRATILNGNLIVTQDNAKADGSAQNAVRARVTDANGNPLANQTVQFSADNGATLSAQQAASDADGYVTVTLTSLTAGPSHVSATLSNHSQASVTTTFVADDSRATILNGNLIVTQDNAKADGSAQNAVRARVTDANGNPLANQTVQFSADNGATLSVQQAASDADGYVTVTLTSLTAGPSHVSATLSNHSQASVTTTFVADDASATILNGNLIVTQDNAKADGNAQNAARARVTDANGNPLANQTVQFSADNGATLSAQQAASDADGYVTVTLTSLTAGPSLVSATLSNHSQARVTTTFVADDASATILNGNLIVTQDNAKADGNAQNAVRARVTDANGNPLANQTVQFSADNGATLSAQQAASDADGYVTVTLTSLTAGPSLVSATLSNHSQASVTTTFVADDASASILNGNLIVTQDNAKADGNAQNAVRARVTDANGNPLANQTVQLSADNGATLSAQQAASDADGYVTVTLTSLTAGPSLVSATLSNHSQASVTTTFVADDASASILNGNLIVTQDNAKADGNAQNAVRARVTDANGNPLANQTVQFSADNGATLSAQQAASDADGYVTVTLTSLTAGPSLVSATLSNHSQARVTTTFVADDASATILNGNLIVTQDNAKADGNAQNAVRARVTDANGNPLANQTVQFSADNGATLSVQQAASDADGYVTVTLTSLTDGPSHVSATLSNNNQASVITTFAPYDVLTGVLVNGKIFTVNEGFPSTGFIGAKFQLQINNDTARNSAYTWSSSAPGWVSISPTGEVQLTTEPATRQPVTLTATAKDGGDTLTYHFDIRDWFISAGAWNYMSADDADAWCSTQGNGYQVPSYTRVTNTTFNLSPGYRDIGGLWTEWGAMASYPASGLPSDQTWSKELRGSTQRYTTGLTTGYLYAISIASGAGQSLVICNRSL
ncbi:Ig-like domain-containing protein [Edwardsiella tarda]|nr:Ig-like domain-containing protein [Edwardsiella tarda]